MEKNRLALITGASNGIGLELAKIFAQQGFDLALVARTFDPLKSLAESLEKEYHIQVKYCVKDLSVSDSPDLIHQSIKSEMLNVDVLVNNAGFGWLGDFASMNPADALDMIQVNVAALTHLTRLILPGMIARKSGRILNVASTAAFQPGPLMTTYYASKAYVLSFSLALAEELRGTGVTVTALCPGPTPTGFGKRAGFSGDRGIAKLISMDAAAVALQGFHGMMKGKQIVIPGWRNVLGTQLVRFLPRTLPGKWIKSYQQKRRV